ncbi:hypothetical protein pb186bvf_001381 [Paramecium bursaria]
MEDVSQEESQSFIASEREQVHANLKGQIRLLPPIYLAMSMIVLSAAILSQFQYARAQTFPLFLELPFQKNQLFTIGNALISLIGILIYYLVYQANQNKIIKKGRYRNQKQKYDFSVQVFMSGAISHLAFLAFALLPMDYKNQSNFLYTEDRILLTFSFIMNFIFTAYYMYFKSKLRRARDNITINQQIKAALFTVICFLFTAFISVNFISLFMGMPLSQGEPDLELSANEDFVALMVGEIYSTLAYSLYLVNNFFIGMYYSDLKQVLIIYFQFQQQDQFSDDNRDRDSNNKE